jgi:acetoin utilization deacetylase AcuC-like enzyme
MRLPIVYHPHYMAPLRPGHRFPMSKYGYLREALVARRLLPEAGGFLSPAPAQEATVAAVHPADYVARVAGARLTAEEARRIGLPPTEAVARRSFLSAAGTLLAARLAIEAGVACNMAGGSHHAGPAGGAGFCVFNDVAVAARALLDEGRVGRILVIDCDVHQGDGTAAIFADEKRVLTLSLHAERNYPARKTRSDIDLALPDGVRDRAYLEMLDWALAQAAGFAAELVFYNAGVDPHGADRLGRLALSDAGLRARDRAVLGWARSRGLPVVGVLGGGYDPDPRVLAERHAILFEEAARALSGGFTPGGCGRRRPGDAALPSQQRLDET